MCGGVVEFHGDKLSSSGDAVNLYFQNNGNNVSRPATGHLPKAGYG
jgi:hypothetical protein